jgi:hypothetical protein
MQVTGLSHCFGHLGLRRALSNLGLHGQKFPVIEERLDKLSREFKVSTWSVQTTLRDSLGK